jgi:hypothetical protein
MPYRGISNHLGEMVVVFRERGSIIFAAEELVEFSSGVSVFQIIRDGS